MRRREPVRAVVRDPGDTALSGVEAVEPGSWTTPPAGLSAGRRTASPACALFRSPASAAPRSWTSSTCLTHPGRGSAALRGELRRSRRRRHPPLTVLRPACARGQSASAVRGRGRASDLPSEAPAVQGSGASPPCGRHDEGPSARTPARARSASVTTPSADVPALLLDGDRQRPTRREDRHGKPSALVATCLTGDPVHS